MDRTAELPGDHRALEPPDPIPNSAVKRRIADGSVGSPHVRVGHRQAPKRKTPCSIATGGFAFKDALILCPYTGPCDAACSPQANGGGDAKRSRRDCDHRSQPKVGHAHKEGQTLARHLNPQRPDQPWSGRFTFRAHIRPRPLMRINALPPVDCEPECSGGCGSRGRVIFPSGSRERLQWTPTPA